MDELIKFLKARLDEDGQAARAATNHTGRWSWDHGFGARCNDPECPYGILVDETEPGEFEAGTVLMEVHGYDVKEPWGGAAHIARHDPARVLREVETKRRLMATFVGCTDGFDFEMLIYEALALPYADHPDYRPEWSPDGS